jgi:hemerythrin
MPLLVEWDSRFSVGNAALDQQHQKLLGLCNSLADCLSADPQQAQFRFHDILHKLTQYAREHFRFEESTLERCDYADLAHQRTEHDAYEEKMADWAFEATMDTLNLLDVQHFLATWWRDHILVSDMRYKPLMEGRRA